MTETKVSVALRSMDSLVSPQASLHELLRTSTQEIHARLHFHPGLLAIQNETIDRESYASLLCRLYGFYEAFETAVELPPLRSRWLTSDLLALNVDADTLDAMPRCPDFPLFNTPAEIIGALYVVEGSSLGGRGLARRLDRVLGAGVPEGRRFFNGYGADTGRAWRDFLLQLSSSSVEPADRASMAGAAILTFSKYEEWLNGWDTPNRK